MNVEDIREYCIKKKSVEEAFPFDNDTLVFKVGGKIFLLLSLPANPVQFNVKCDPAKAVGLRETYSWIIPGFHMNKTHWNTVICNNKSSRKVIFECINDSYDLILRALPSKTRKTLGL